MHRFSSTTRLFFLQSESPFMQAEKKHSLNEYRKEAGNESFHFSSLFHAWIALKGIRHVVGYTTDTISSGTVSYFYIWEDYWYESVLHDCFPHTCHPYDKYTYTCNKEGALESLQIRKAPMFKGTTMMFFNKVSILCIIMLSPLEGNQYILKSTYLSILLYYMQYYNL